MLLEPVPDGKPGQRRIRAEEWPDPAFVDVGIRGDLSEFDDAPVVSPDGHAVEVEEQKFIEAVAAVMGRRMETDDGVVVMGEDVHRLNGGTNGATRGLPERFPGRVLGTPISENAFAGLGGGIALDGRFTPVVEFMYADFMWVAADQLFNQIGKARHMYGGTGDVPLVLRSKVAMGTGYGSQHSMDPAGVFATSAGWRIVAPTTPYDYVGLMNSALRCKDPVLVLEHVDLYNTTGPGPVDDLDYCLPVGKAAVRRTGSDVTVLSYLAMVPYVLEAVERFGELDAEVDRPALARPGQHRLGHHRGQPGQDQQAADRRAGSGGHVVRRLAGRRDPPPVLRPPRRTRCGASPAARRRPASARCSSGPPSRRPTRSSRCWPRSRGTEMARLLRMPEVAANATEAVLADWSVPENVAFAAQDSLATVETEKALVDVEADQAGVVLKALVLPGSQVEVGAPIAVLGDPGEQVADLDALLADLGVAATPTAARAGAARRTGSGGRHRLDAPVRPLRRARHAGTGSSRARWPASSPRTPASRSSRSTARDPGSRILRRDVERGAGRTGLGPGGHDAAPGTAYEDQPHSRVRRATAARLTESVQTAPHFYVRATVRVDRLVALRAELNAEEGVAVSLNDLVVKAAAAAHRRVPEMNVVWTEDAVRSFRDVDIAVAVATDRGLLTPVVRDVAGLSVTALAARVKDLAERARAGRLRQEELEGGTMSVTNLGMYGTEEFAAIINPPHASILAVGAVREEPVVAGRRARRAAG